jgi:hypothetical protein
MYKLGTRNAHANPVHALYERPFRERLLSCTGGSSSSSGGSSMIGPFGSCCWYLKMCARSTVIRENYKRTVDGDFPIE